MYNIYIYMEHDWYIHIKIKQVLNFRIQYAVLFTRQLIHKTFLYNNTQTCVVFYTICGLLLKVTWPGPVRFTNFIFCYQQKKRTQLVARKRNGNQLCCWLFICYCSKRYVFQIFGINFSFLLFINLCMTNLY